MDCCELAKKMLNKLKKLRKLIFSDTIESKKERVKLEEFLSLNYTRLRSNCDNKKIMKDLDQPDIIVDEVPLESIDQMTREIEKFLEEYCQDE